MMNSCSGHGMVRILRESRRSSHPGLVVGQQDVHLARADPALSIVIQPRALHEAVSRITGTRVEPPATRERLVPTDQEQRPSKSPRDRISRRLPPRTARGYRRAAVMPWREASWRPPGSAHPDGFPTVRAPIARHSQQRCQRLLLQPSGQTDLFNDGRPPHSFPPRAGKASRRLVGVPCLHQLGRL